MFVGEADAQGNWTGGLQPYGTIQLEPSAQVLNYGQSVFEGMKAQRSARGRIVLFRPDCNAARMQEGAGRLSMAAPPADFFIDAVQQTVVANAELVPPQGSGSLYLRPLLLGTGPILGLGPAPSYQLYVYCAAVGAYFKGGQLTPIDLIVESRFHRAAPGGMGGTKCAGNYSPVLVVQLAAKKAGYADVVYLDAKTDTYLEEVSSCNIFVVKGKTIKTPPLTVCLHCVVVCAVANYCVQWCKLSCSVITHHAGHHPAWRDPSIHHRAGGIARLRRAGGPRERGRGHGGGRGLHHGHGRGGQPGWEPHTSRGTAAVRHAGGIRYGA